MKVLLTCLGLRPQSANGSSRYAFLLAKALKDLERPALEVATYWGPELTSPLAGIRTRALIAGWARWGKPTSFVFPKPKGPESLLHSVESVSVPTTDYAPLVVTVHDIFALNHPELVPPRLAKLKQWSWRRRHKWSAVITGSAATAEDLVQRGLERDRVHVIRYAVAPTLATPARAEDLRRIRARIGRDPFVMTVGAPSWKKGSDILLRAWAKVRSPARRLVWVAKSNKELAADPLILCTGSVNDNELAALYAEAQAVLVPSRWEGFSFAVAEALAQGTGVIASDIPVHREFGSAPVKFFELENISQFVDLIDTAFQIPTRHPRVVVGDWLDVARRTVDVYEASLA